MAASGRDTGKRNSLATATPLAFDGLMKVLLFRLVTSTAGFCAEPCELLVETVTGKGKNDGTDAGVHLRINDLETRYSLDAPKHNDRQAGAKDSYPGIPLDIEPGKIKTIVVEIDGQDAWFMKSIVFRVVCGGRSSKELVFNKRDWLSTAKETVYARDSIKLQIDGKLALD
jgi:hypothetical protein